MTATTADTKLTRAEAAYAHMASFQRGQHVIVSGRRFAFEGTITTVQQHDFSDVNRAFLVVSGNATREGNGGWQTVQMDVKVTVGRMLSRECLTVIGRDHPGDEPWPYFDAATWAMQNPEG